VPIVIIHGIKVLVVPLPCLNHTIEGIPFLEQITNDLVDDFGISDGAKVIVGERRRGICDI
jgi:hypothetical protein